MRTTLIVEIGSAMSGSCRGFEIHIVWVSLHSLSRRVRVRLEIVKPAFVVVLVFWLHSVCIDMRQQPLPSADQTRSGLMQPIYPAAHYTSIYILP